MQIINSRNISMHFSYINEINCSKDCSKNYILFIMQKKKKYTKDAWISTGLPTSLKTKYKLFHKINQLQV